MKKKQRKVAQKQLASSVVAIIALSFGFSVSASAAEKLPQSLQNHKQANKSVQYEMVPHVVLPETIQYKPLAKNADGRPNGQAGGSGNASPFVASYTAFPSYRLPGPTEMQVVGDAVYPVTAAVTVPQPLPLPKNAKEGNSAKESEDSQDLQNDELREPNRLAKKVLPKNTTVATENDAPVQLASNQQAVVPATPLSFWDNDIIQAGLFCQKPVEPPSAWSFTSPIFKAASVPMNWNGASHTGYITQTGPRGCLTQVGFQPGMQQPGTGQQMMQPADAAQAGNMMQGGMMPPMHTMQMGQNGQMGQQMMPQAYQLPNGMTLLALPPDHRNCGVFRCRCGNQPRMVLLPGAPMGVSNAMPSPMPGTMQAPLQTPLPNAPASNEGGMMLPMGQPSMMMQPTVQPVMAMTPYGMAVVGYQYAPQYMQQTMIPAMTRAPMSGMTQADAQAGYANLLGANQTDSTESDGAAADKVATRISATGIEITGAAVQQAAAQTAVTPTMATGMTPMPMVTSHNMHANMLASGANGGAVNGGMMNNGFGYSGVYMTPYGMVTLGAMPMNGVDPMGFGVMSQPMNVGYSGFNNSGFNGGGFGGQMDMNRPVTMNDLMMFMAMMNNQKAEPRRGRLLQRLAERREARQAGRSHDPFEDLMAFWTSPYTPADSTMRMPSRTAYPYGYFGAQVAPQTSAHFGGYHDLYSGSTTYPGTFGLY